MITKIHSKYYDLSKFQHPGGITPLCIACNRDATELFESHHLFADRDKLLKVLEKYEIKNTDVHIEDANEFDWDETLNSEFTKEFKGIIKNSLNDIKASKAKWLQMFTLFCMYAINAFYYFQGNHYALFVYPFSLWLFTVNIYHDASHFALSYNPSINQLGTYSALMFSLTYNWYHQHIIGHHCYVNILSKDPDLYHSPLYVRHTQNIRKNKYHVYQYISAWFLWLVAVPLGLIMTGFIKSLQSKAYNKVVSLSKALDYKTMYYELAFVVFHMFVCPYMATKNILFVIYPYAMYSVLFMLCTQINHLVEDTFQTHKNFFIHQIINSHNVAPQSFLTYLFTGGLNMQIEHHLMPSVNSCHLRTIQPKLQRLCEKYGIKYNCSTSLSQAVYKHYKHLMKYAL
jgi:fatty acid desaturase